MEKDPIRPIYDRLERTSLIIIACSIPVFAIVYLYSQNNTLDFDRPNLPAWLDFVFLGFIYAILAVGYMNFHKAIKVVLANPMDLLDKVIIYKDATLNRLKLLLLSSILSPTGLLIFENNGYIIAYALTLVLISLGKPSPDRMVRLMRLKGEEKERVIRIKTRES
ncbi:hypothetical protein SAMN06295967_101398 [Belliella buryatensis]|uniref:Uncharacterized protein n=1 Tax=Belliella buryatensis TaxID=1500549 RepID=A0A239AU06_9BACT|nr:hypothetical protein [Belliella buryatensis]SNR99176.1 hypothetical protein SAMN06295967_101398 [Belliella buryatensis]